ncbi:DUF2489 domain-containing protein [Marinobacter lutaoensis]|uniref:DUF2489 domain-containing protein n=1 Tax=Marinobacter lutaoensis TaxID=135739 RepID=A0A1V2DNV8_9GAMM|nr:DUF2489 domain-containing protein [Marinobacter lutaoensis]MBE03444.1 DUF2489 domain-containing protein [Marinobacter sp.]ONF42334.1 hypothetical protein BTO32_16210 [Marinobacter lutaoensis]|tara:strand:- start:2620 stop:3096 length:477 start_codon:yes stop_codon:yes gene_type:complete
MPPWLQWTLIIAGLAVIGLLLAFIRRQLKLLGDDRRRRQKTEALQRQRREHMIESIRVIALAVEEDQIETSEACLRLKGLLDHVAPELLERAPFQIFLEVHEKLKHMPTHRARRQADPELLATMDEERFAVEARHAEAILEAARAIRHFPFPESAPLR